MRILLPSYLSARTIYSVIGQVVTDRFDLRSDRFRFDFSPLMAIEPAGIVALSSLVETLRQAGAACSALTQTTAGPDPVLLTLHRTGFFSEVFALENRHDDSLDPIWMPLTRLQPSLWHPNLEALVFRWVASRLGVSRFAPGWKLAGIAALHPVEDSVPGSIYASARVDAERGRLALALAGKTLSEPEAAFSRVVAGLSYDAESWIGLHAGWELYNTLPGTNRTNRLPSPVPYPGWLLETVFNIAGIVQHPILNEPHPSPSPTVCDECTPGALDAKRVPFPGVHNPTYS